MKKDIAIIGLGTFGKALAIRLAELGHGILAIDIDAKKVNDLKDKVEMAVQADITDEDVLKKLELDKFDEIIFGMSSALESVILAVTLMKKMSVKHIIGKANTKIKKEILLKIGVDEVVLPEISTALRLADKLDNPDILDKFQIDENSSLVEMAVPEKFVGKSPAELDLRKKYGMNVIMIKRGNTTGMLVNPEMKFSHDDIIFAVGDDKAIDKFLKK